MIGLLVAIASFATDTGQPSSPQILNLRGLVSWRDYPAGALLLEQEGTTGISLEVDARGKATGCTVDQPSGAASLDEQTCRVFVRRAKFAPARDSSGRPTAGRYHGRLTWRMTDTELPIAPWTVRVLALVPRKGTMRDCGVESGGALKDRPRGIVKCSELAGTFAVPPELLQKVAGKETILVFDKQFVPKVLDSITTPRDLRHYRFLGQEIVRLKIGQDGAVISCTKTRTEAYAPAIGACETLPRRRFEIPIDGNGQATPIWATATLSVYALP